MGGLVVLVVSLVWVVDYPANMEMSRVLMLVVVAAMLLGVLALVVWIFRIVFQSARGIMQTMGASPAGPLRELGLTVTSDVMGGVGQGQWKGIAVQVGWSMTAPPVEADFSTTVVAFFSEPLALGIAVHEQSGAHPCGIPGLDGLLYLSAVPSPRTHGLLAHWAPQIRHVLDAPGRLQITDEHVSIRFEEIVGDKRQLTDALEQVSTLHAALSSHG